MKPNTTCRFVIITMMLAVSLSTALNAHAQTETVLYSFKGKADGALPSGDLIFDADENIYGTATTGGQPCGFSEVGCGVVYRLAPGAAGWVQTVLYAFTGGADGAGPGGFIYHSVGDLFVVARRRWQSWLPARFRLRNGFSVIANLEWMAGDCALCDHRRGRWLWPNLEARDGRQRQPLWHNL